MRLPLQATTRVAYPPPNPQLIAAGNLLLVCADIRVALDDALDLIPQPAASADRVFVAQYQITQLQRRDERLGGRHWVDVVGELLVPQGVQRDVGKFGYSFGLYAPTLPTCLHQIETNRCEY